ncbi:unnamed protein product [Sympodiomycopsis kandeliae]
MRPDTRSSRSRGIPMARLLIPLLALLSVLVPSALSLGVVSFDYGADSLKTALVKPGMTPDVVLTRDSKRKLPAVVAWKGEDRSFGTDAMNLASRYPGDTFPDLKLLLGRSDEPRDQTLRDRYAALLGSTNITSTDRNTLAITRATDYTNNKEGPDTHTVEELVAMQLAHARMLAEETAGEKVRQTYPGTIGTFGGLDTVVTVPTFWTASERQAIFDAATLAGFRPRLVSDAGAAATSYALNRNFPTPELHLFYDAGHSATRASLVRFSTKSFPTEDMFGTSLKEHTFIEVISTGWSRQAGGLALDETLRDILVDKFTTANPSQPVISQNPRAMAKLLASANKAKHVLSANQDARVSIEGLVGDVDFRTSVTRDEFEQAVAAKGLEDQFGGPIKDALRRSGKTKFGDLNSVVLIGGTSRVPLVQRAINSAGVTPQLIAQNLNADEAITLGAGFYGASFNPQLRMKPVRLADVNAFPILLREKDGKEDTLWKGSPETFEEEVKPRYYDGQTEDFSFEIEYAPQEEGSLDTFERPLYRVEVEEIENTLRAIKESGELNKVETSVNVSIVARPLGTVVVESAWLTVKPKPSIAGALRGFFGGSAAKVSNTTDSDAGKEGEVAAAEGDNSTTTQADTLHDQHFRLSVKTFPLGSVKPMSGLAQQSSKDKLYLLDSTARRKLQREEVRNKVESYVYRMRELVSPDTVDSHFESSSKLSERQEIEKASTETNEWLNSAAGDRSSLEELRTRLSKLEKLVKPIETRMEESKGRSGASKRLLRSFETTHQFLSEANANLTAAIESKSSSSYSRTDLDSLESSLKSDEKWFNTVNTAQEKKRADEEPAWKVDDAEKRAKKLVERVYKLKKRRIPKTRPIKINKPKVNTTEEKPVEEKVEEKPVKEEKKVPPKHEEL